MKFVPNNWRAIKAFYREAHAEVMAAGANEWGIPCYLWDSVDMIRFTPIEYWLWHDIRAVDAVLYPQYPAGRFFVDFGNPVAKVAIECDGQEWHDARKDAARDAELARIGWTVYRFPGWMCKTDFDEETRTVGQAYARMLEIAERHGIDRKSRTKGDDGEEGFVPMCDMVDEIVHSLQRDACAVAAARRAMA